MRTITAHFSSIRGWNFGAKKNKNDANSRSQPWRTTWLLSGEFRPDWSKNLAVHDPQRIHAMSTAECESLISLCLRSAGSSWLAICVVDNAGAILIAFCYPPCSIYSSGYHTMAHTRSPLSGLASTPACVFVYTYIMHLHVCKYSISSVPCEKHICINYRCDVSNREQNNL